MELDAKQNEAIARCCDVEKRIVPVTGQAGTGKTTILRMVHEALEAAGHNVVLCAPTGKAAKRIQEATGIEAMTIHRLLEYPRPGEIDQKTGKPLVTTDPKRDRSNPLEQNVVLADEYAMVNHEVHSNLVWALPRGGVLRTFGDVNQLPPIESNRALQDKPTPFADLLKKFDGVTLGTIHRQGIGSGVVLNGAKILKGRIPSRLEDFTMDITQQPIEKLREYVMWSMEEGIDFRSIDHQILTPSNKTWVGVHKLNATLQLILRPEIDGWLDLPRHKWDESNPIRVREGDKVIWTENNYDLAIMNGESGVVEEVTEYGEIIIDFGDRIVTVPPSMETTKRDGTLAHYDPRKSLQLAYAITTHKAQGSEYRHVVYVLNKSTLFTQGRHNFYTAVTRAREHVHVISDQRSLSASVQVRRG